MPEEKDQYTSDSEDELTSEVILDLTSKVEINFDNFPPLDLSKLTELSKPPSIDFSDIIKLIKESDIVEKVNPKNLLLSEEDFLQPFLNSKPGFHNSWLQPDLSKIFPLTFDKNKSNKLFTVLDYQNKNSELYKENFPILKTFLLLHNSREINPWNDLPQELIGTINTYVIVNSKMEKEQLEVEVLTKYKFDINNIMKLDLSYTGDIDLDYNNYINNDY